MRGLLTCFHDNTKQHVIVDSSQDEANGVDRSGSRTQAGSDSDDSEPEVKAKAKSKKVGTYIVARGLTQSSYRFAFFRKRLPPPQFRKSGSRTTNSFGQRNSSIRR